MSSREISKDQLRTDYKFYLNVGELKSFLEKNDLPDDAPVLIQRVEDKYYEKHNWGVYSKQSPDSIIDEDGNVWKSIKEQYHPAFECARYKNDEDLLFINLHF